MNKLHLVTRIHVLTAIKVHDQDGAPVFLERLGFDEPGEELLIERGKRYPAWPLLAYAHGRATGRPLAPHELPETGLTTLTDLGFRVATREELEKPLKAPARTPRPRTTAAKPKAAAKPEPVVRLCPTCFTALPVSGHCDYCD